MSSTGKINQILILVCKRNRLPMKPFFTYDKKERRIKLAMTYPDCDHRCVTLCRLYFSKQLQTAGRMINKILLTKTSIHWHGQKIFKIIETITSTRWRRTLVVPVLSMMFIFKINVKETHFIFHSLLTRVGEITQILPILKVNGKCDNWAEWFVYEPLIVKWHRLSSA